MVILTPFDQTYGQKWWKMEIYEVIMKHEDPTYYSAPNWPLNPVVSFVFGIMAILS